MSAVRAQLGFCVNTCWSSVCHHDHEVQPQHFVQPVDCIRWNTSSLVVHLLGTRRQCLCVNFRRREVHARYRSACMHVGMESPFLAVNSAVLQLGVQRPRSSLLVFHGSASPCSGAELADASERCASLVRSRSPSLASLPICLRLVPGSPILNSFSTLPVTFVAVSAKGGC